MPTLLKALCFTAALAAFIWGAIRNERSMQTSDHIPLLIGLAFFTLPFAWDAWEGL